jgi:hypothetical protein
MDDTEHDKGAELAAALNRDCHCIAVDEGELRESLQAEIGERGPAPRLLEERPHLFAASPVFLSRRHVEQMREIIGAVEAVVGSSPYLEEVLSRAPAIARESPGPLGVFLGYDFHIAVDGPRLIEINTNAGGALLHLHLARAQRACCHEVEDLVMGDVDVSRLEESLLEMFRAEWRLQRGERSLERIAIVDEDPPGQFLHPELVLFEGLFRRHGIQARLADPRQLAWQDGVLGLGGSPVDLVYNRLTDFYLEAPAQAALAQAYRSGAVVLTPHPRAHALYASKRNLALLSDPQRLSGWGVDPGTTELLARGVPRTVTVTPDNADQLWAARRRLFFKPLAGYGSRGAYRGDKLTRRVWRSILASDYVAQETIPPSERQLVVDGSSRALKLDIRCFVYAGEIQLLASRIYQGQATNLRTEGGGLATVFTTPALG